MDSCVSKILKKPKMDIQNIQFEDVLCAVFTHYPWCQTETSFRTDSQWPHARFDISTSYSALLLKGPLLTTATSRYDVD